MSTTPAAERAALDGPAVLANARGLEKLLREEADEVEQRRQLTPRVVDALRASGVFRMAMPASRGGPEIDILTQVEILEAVSRADGSAGWCAMIGSDGGFYSASLDDAAGRELSPTSTGSRPAGSIPSAGSTCGRAGTGCRAGGPSGAGAPTPT